MKTDDFDPAIARIDAYRAKRVGEILITRQSEQIDPEPESVLVDIEAMNGRQLLAEYRERQAKYATTPFDPDGSQLRLFPGGLTVWSGFPGGGKTTLIRQMICHTLKRGSSVFLASLEEHPRNVLVSLAGTAAGSLEPNEHQLQWFIDEYQKRFRLWGIVGIVQHLKLLTTIRELADQGVKHAFIDSLMCLDVRNDDFEAQRKFANLVANTARAANIHIHLVAHPRKLVSSNQELDLNDVAGAREIGGMADNVIFVRRTQSKLDYNPTAVSTPMCISVRKQRHGSGALGDITGWYRRSWRQFTIDQFTPEPIRYLPDDAFMPLGHASVYA